MSALKNYRLELTDFEQVDLEKREQKIKKSTSEEIAINMLKKASKVDFVSEVTGLTIKEVEELKSNLE